MIPTVDVCVGFDVPADAHLPHPEDVTEEGLGFFRDVWLLDPLPVDEARRILDDERKVVAVIDYLAHTPADFERLATIADLYNPDDDNTIEQSDREAIGVDSLAVLERTLQAREDWITGIELGVGGLVAALSTVGFLTQASCRGHQHDTGWSDRPTVYLLGRRDQLMSMEPAVRSAGCRLVPAGQAGMVVVEAPSIVQSARLAGAILDDASAHADEQSLAAVREILAFVDLANRQF